jgi:gluconokinase
MIVLVMGVSGSGKSTIAARLAARMDWRMIDADDHHAAEAIAKMRRGEPLTDADRLPWLARLNAVLRAAQARGEQVVLACSALRAMHRQRIAEGLDAVRVVYLRGDSTLLRTRLDARRDHFMPPALLQSQLDTLEPPRDALTVEIGATPDAIVDHIVRALDAGAPGTAGRSSDQ